LVISAFNYPLQLALLPAIAALGAGNAVLIKPSELAPHTSHLLARLLPKYLLSDAGQGVALVEGGINTNQALLKHRFDYIFFTVHTISLYSSFDPNISAH
jgi:aldehyde dehydrogenase (NAD+)